MALSRLLRMLGSEIEDPEEETFLLFSQALPKGEDLGIVDPKATTLGLVVAGRDFTIRQSPTVLTSSREGGTTGAVAWKVTTLFAAWIADPAGPMLASGVLGPASSVVELGCGVSALNALATRPFVARYLLTDQAYVSRLVMENLAENGAGCDDYAGGGKEKAKQRHKTSGGQSASSRRYAGAAARPSAGINFVALDWEQDDVGSVLRAYLDRSTTAATADIACAAAGRFDLVVACDCVYSDHLVRPLVDACADACAARIRTPPRSGGADSGFISDDDGNSNGNGNDNVVVVKNMVHSEIHSGIHRTIPVDPRSSVCVVAQQLRHADVFSSWLDEFCRRFRAWRVPDESLPIGLRSSSGFVVHIGVPRSV